MPDLEIGSIIKFPSVIDLNDILWFYRYTEGTQ